MIMNKQSFAPKKEWGWLRKPRARSYPTRLPVPYHVQGSMSQYVVNFRWVGSIKDQQSNRWKDKKEENMYLLSPQNWRK